MPSEVEKQIFINDAFISYSRKDIEFARRLEKALEDYKPPRNLKVPQRNLVVFRDEADFTGVEYEESIEKHLKNSRKMIVICSLDARKSKYVNDEIRRFAEARGADNIVPVLLSGIPNNEATPGQEDEMAFPEALCKVQKMPLATEYRDFNSQKDRVKKGRFESQWYMILANIYELSRAEVEQREKKRQARNRRITIGIVSGVIISLSALLVYALVSRQEAKKQARIALARQLAAQAELSANRFPNQLQRSALLAIESLRRYPTSEAAQTLQQTIALLPRSLVVIRHTGPVRAVTFEPHGNSVITAGEDGMVCIWDVVGKQESRTVPFTQGATFAMFSSDGNYLAAVGKDKTVWVWSISNGTEIGSARFKGDRPILAFSPEGRYFAIAAEGGVELWDLQSAKRMSCINQAAKKDRISAIAVSQDGKYVATSAAEELQVTTGFCQKVVATRSAEGGHIISIAFSPNGDYVAIGREYQEVQLFSVERKQNVSSSGHKGLVNLVVYDSSGTHVASASSEPSVMVWNVERENLNAVSRIPIGSRITAIAFSSVDEGPSLVATTTGNMVHIWDLAFAGIPSMNIALAREVARMIHEKTITSIALSPDGRYLATASEDGTARMWELFGGKVGHSAGISNPQHLVLGPEGKHLVLIGNAGSQCQLYSLGGSGKSLQFNGDFDSPEGVNGAAFSSDERYLATFGENGIGVFEVSTREKISTIPIRAEIVAAAFMKDGSRIVAVERGGGIGFWDVRSGREIGGRTSVDAEPIRANLTPDGNRLLVSTSKSAQVWDPVSGKRIAETTTVADVIDVALSEDGGYIAIATEDRKVRIWDAARKQDYSILDIDDLVTDNTFSRMVFTKDGKNIAIERGQGFVQIWNIQERRGVSSVPIQFPGPIAFSRDMKYLITVEPQVFANMGLVELNFSLWHPEDLIVEACSRITRNFIESEWREYFGDEIARKACQELLAPEKENRRKVQSAGDKESK